MIEKSIPDEEISKCTGFKIWVCLIYTTKSMETCMSEEEQQGEK